MEDITAPTPATPMALRNAMLMAKNILPELFAIKLVNMAPAMPIPRTMPTFRAVANMP